MDSREKANDLVNRYYYMLPNNGKLNEGINSCDSRYKEAIECAFVTVDEVIEQWEYIDTYLANGMGELNPNLKHWYEVKQWIQKIKDKEPGAQWTIEDMRNSSTVYSRKTITL
jgi:hypothetical protein